MEPILGPVQQPLCGIESEVARGIVECNRFNLLIRAGLRRALILPGFFRPAKSSPAKA
jgi:hypothetical protein